MVTARNWHTSPSKERPVGPANGSASAGGFEFKLNMSQALPEPQKPDSFGEAVFSADAIIYSSLPRALLACSIFKNYTLA